MSDAVNDVPMTEARATLTDIIRKARYGDEVTAFTERGKRVAFVVSPEFYERALRAMQASQ